MNATPDKKVKVIVGLGKTGLSCARYFHSHGEAFKVVDNRFSPPCLPEFEAEFPFSDIELGSIRGTKDEAVGERAPGGDNQESAFEEVLAISTTEETIVPIDISDGDLEMLNNAQRELVKMLDNPEDVKKVLANAPLQRRLKMLEDRSRGE